MNPEKITSIASAFYSSALLFAASDAGLFSALNLNRPCSLQELDQNLNLNRHALRLVLDACTAIGLLDKNEQGWMLSEEAKLFLTPESPANLSEAIRYNRDVYDAWGKLPQFLKTGKPVESPQLHLGDNPERTRVFAESMRSRARGIGRCVVPLLELEDANRLLDVGGGPAAYASMIAQNNPDLRVVTMDLPAISEIAREIVREEGVADRVECIAGDYRKDDFPKDFDVVIFFGVLHQESPESIISLFKKAAASLRPGGSVYVLDLMTDPTRCKPEFSALFAVNMALTTDNGWVFSSDELEGWLREAGFQGFSVKPLPSPMPHWLAKASLPAD